MQCAVAVLGFTFWGASGVAIIAGGCTDLYCHSEPLPTSGKLCFIINFIGGKGRADFLLGVRGPSWLPPPFEPPLAMWSKNLCLSRVRGCGTHCLHSTYSFYPSDLESSITHLQNALQQISSWMTANILTLNSSKTEFLLIRLKQQLAKISSCSLDTAYFARNLGFIFDEHISFSKQISALSKSCYSHIRQLRCIRLYLDLKTASTIATSSCTPSLTTATHFTTTYQILNWTIFTTSKILSHMPWSGPRSFCHINTALKSLHWLKIKQHIDYKILFLTYEVLTTAQLSYLYNLICSAPS